METTDAAVIAESDTVATENNAVAPRGLKITGILLVVICGVQLLGWNIMLAVAAYKLHTNFGDAVIYSSSIFGSIIPLLGLIAGIGILLRKPWSKTLAIVFAVIAILLYGTVLAIIFTTDPTWRYSIHVILFPIAFLLGLPIWTLGYLTRPRIRALFRR